ncbi:MAG: pyridoxamine 5'-phosphate oxidase family protein, partial [bacterium]
MTKLSEPMKWIIRNFSVGMVATVNQDGTPAVSPKATFVILNDSTLAFGDIRSPGTVSNLLARPHTETNFVDILNRRAVRVKGTAAIIEHDSEEGENLARAFEAQWQPYLRLMRNFVCIN